MPRPFARILQPSDPWFREPADEGELTEAFRGGPDSISVCETTECPPELALAAFYGHTTRLTPVRPAWLSFTDIEVEEDGGRLEKTDAFPPWPPEYNGAHHDVVAGQDAVAAAMARRSLAEPGRRHVTDRVGLVVEIVRLSQRADAPSEFVERVRRRLRRLHREEAEFFGQVEALLPGVRALLAEEARRR